MPLKASTSDFSAAIFNQIEREQLIAPALSRSAKGFKEKTRLNMIESAPAGRVYSRRRGIGFTRAHRASAWGQRPAPDTLNLVNSLEDNKISATAHEVLVNPGRAPYADPLQNSFRLNRPIMSPEDALEWEITGHAEEMVRLQRELGAVD